MDETRVATGLGLRAGKWEWARRRREPRADGPADGQAFPRPRIGLWLRSLVQAVRAAAAGLCCLELTGSREVSPQQACPGALLDRALAFAAGANFTQAPRRFSTCTSSWIFVTGPLFWSSLHFLPLDLGVPPFTMPEVSGVA